jgi:hypothetical protein
MRGLLKVTLLKNGALNDYFCYYTRASTRRLYFV